MKIKDNDFICIIPARGGSKGLKNKNLLKINSIPLVLWPINSAKKVKFIRKIVLSSDSKKILNIAKNKIVDFHLRPKYLATDTATTFSVIKNILEKKEYKNFKNIICLEPTSPFTNSKIIEKSIKLFLKSKAQSLVTIAEANQSSPNFLFKKYTNKILKPYIKSKKYNHLRRQDIKKTYFPDGSLYISDTVSLIKNKGFFGKKTIGYLIPKFYNLEIDDKTDLNIARSIAKYNNLK
ncbi:acylneuraminate cytidylyltransferase family protein [Candidatus Pelagibacter sp.]|uniref:acylneuraminate cytidylyltransferase family protein n=1 Tax=Candidatus Pelagibacter sp. TaxID=2024849 RepID=UPI003F83E5EB